MILRNPAAGTYTVSAAPFAPAPGDPSYTATAILAEETGGPGSEPIAYINYVPPSPLGRTAAEPSGGVNWNTDKVMSIAFFETLETSFNDCTSPARETWEDVTFPLTGAATADPILFTDSLTGRTFVSQLAGETSLMAFTDNDGLTWIPSQGGGIVSGVDHQTVGGGRFHDPLTRDPSGPLYPHAVYYCSQALADAFCNRSDDGGLTFNQGVVIYTALDCGGLHGAVKVSPLDGTVYVPNKNCTEQAVIVNEVNGEAIPPGWVIRRIIGSTAGRFDPSVAIANDGTIYVGYGDGDGHPKVAVSHDKGANWINIADVGTAFGIKNTAFPAMVAGDGDRAAFAFLGAQGICVGGSNPNALCSLPADCTGGGVCTGNTGADSDPSWPGIWHLYVAHTYDSGLTWTTVNVTPNDPVQRGMVCSLGLGCGGARNLLDFMDAEIDRQGRVLITYADGCGGSCLADPPNSGTQLLTIARQVNGRRMFSEFDGGTPAAPLATGTRDPLNPSLVHLAWSTPDDHGSPITAYNIRRRTSPSGTYALIASVGPEVHAYDDTVDPNQSYLYRITAVNAVGEGSSCGEVCPGCVPPPDPCFLPGLQVLTDPPGDFGAPGENQHDILSVSAAGMFTEDGPARLVFTMKVDNLESPPVNSAWRTIWTSPTDAITYYVEMNTFDPVMGVQFVHGTFDGTIFTTVGPADGGSFSADGTIEITISTSLVGNPQAGQTLTQINARTDLLVGGGGTGALILIDNAPGPGSFTLANCISNAPDAVDDVAQTPFETPIVIDVLANDTDPTMDPLTVIAVTQPANGSAVNNGDGTVTYTPNAGFDGVDTFTYTVSDPDGLTDTATVTVIVGECQVAPLFAGIQSVTQSRQSNCSLDLAWNAGAAVCPGESVRYNVYRSTSPSFTPSLDNAVALRVEGLSYRDGAYLTSGVTYHYIVRAEDTTTSNAGPNGGNEEANLQVVSGVPVGPLATGPPFVDDIEPTAEPGYSVFTTRDVGMWEVTLDPTAHSLTQSWVVPDDQPGSPILTARDDTLTLPPLNLTSSSVLTFWHNFDFARFPTSGLLTRYQSAGILEISADGVTWRDLGANPATGVNLPYILAPNAYNGVVSRTATTPFAVPSGPQRRAWVGSTDGDNVAGRGDLMRQVTVNVGTAIQDFYGVMSLPGAKLRFRMGGTFQILLGGIQGSGWGVDDIVVTGVLAPGACSTPSVPAAHVQLRANKVVGGDITLVWDPSCLSTDTNYEVYEGMLGSFYSHTEKFCTTAGETSQTLTPPAGSAYYIVVPRNLLREGSYGTDSTGTERPTGVAPTCLPREVAVCPAS